MDISDDISNAPTLITASSPNKSRVTPRESWPSPPSSTLPLLPLHPRTISFAKPLDGAHDHVAPISTLGLPCTSRFAEPTPSGWFLQRLQKRLRPEDIPCIPNTERQYQKRYRPSKGNRREVRPPLCLFLNCFDPKRNTPRINNVASAKRKLSSPRPKPFVSPKSSVSVEDITVTTRPSLSAGIADHHDPYRPSWNDIVSQTVQVDDDSDCFSISSIDATFEMHHYVEDVAVPAASHHPTLLLPMFRGNGTKVKHPCNNTRGVKGSVSVLPPLVENDSPGGDSRKR
jgi:hypothetical protein